MNTPRRLIAFAAIALSPFALAHDGDHSATDAPPDARGVTHLVIAGEGANTYQSVPNWCQMPEGRKNLGSTHGGVVVDKKGNIYFSMDTGPDAILVYGPDGKMIKGIGGADLLKIHGMCLNEENGEEFIYAAHLAGARAVKLKLDGTIVWSIPVPMESGKYKDAKQYKPTGIAVAPDGTVYVADGYGQNWVHKFDKDQKYVMSFGGQGTEPGKFKTCHGIALDKRGEKPLLLVCDRENRRLQHFDLDGKFVEVVAENLRRPCSLSFHNGQVAVAELEARVTILDKQNKEIAHLGDNPNKQHWANFNVPPAEWKPGIFTAPHGVSFDRNGDVYVMDWNASGRVSKFKHVADPAKQAGAPAGAPAVASR